ncbi:alpha/beta hydrolase [Egicoccus halophilus]|uniref:alpha/beta hydrolase n=1 Tax=Egicoccus halophilus TaxID=1670830 RepID=UPI0013EE4E31|nr:alpha/beta fold hydrolase [Egicoccus halophilus]
MNAVVAIEGAEPWGSLGSGERADIGVVVTHGFTGNPRATRPIGLWFAAEEYAVEVPLLPGHGTSVRELGRTRYADWYAALERTVDHLAGGCSRIVLVGHSMGGTLSLDFASRNPGRVAAVAALNAQVSDPVQPLARLAPVLQYVVPYVPRDLAGLPADDIARPGTAEGAYPLVSTRAAQSLIGQLPRLRRQLERLTMPLLVAWSPDDHTVPAANARALRDLVGSEQVTEVVCERSYHVPQLDYDADKLRASLLAFVAEHVG